MRTAILAAAALGFLGLQVAAKADDVARYQGAMSVQHISAPQRTQALAQAEGNQGQTNYGRGYAQAEGPRGQTTYGRGFAQAEGTGGQTNYGRQLAQAEAPNVAQVRRYAAGEQTGVDNSRLA